MSSSKVTLKEPSHHGQRLVFGSMTLGGRVNEEDSRKQLNIYFDFHDPSDYVEIDSAHFYGNGQTEEYLGKLTTAEQKKRWRMATKGTVSFTSCCTLTRLFTLYCFSLEAREYYYHDVKHFEAGN